MALIYEGVKICTNKLTCAKKKKRVFVDLTGSNKGCVFYVRKMSRFCPFCVFSLMNVQFEKNQLKYIAVSKQSD